MNSSRGCLPTLSAILPWIAAIHFPEVKHHFTHLLLPFPFWPISFRIPLWSLPLSLSQRTKKRSKLDAWTTLESRKDLNWMVFGVLNYIKSAFIIRGFPGGSDGKEFACNAGDLGLIPGLGRPPGEGNNYCLQILAWRIPWREAPGKLQFMGSQEWDTTWQLNHHHI